MHKILKENPKKSISAVIISVMTALSGTGYSVYEYSKELASKDYVKEQIVDLSLEILSVAIMRYEDELMSIEFLMETNKAKPMDRAKKRNIERRLLDLKNKKNKLEDHENKH